MAADASPATARYQPAAHSMRWPFRPAPATCGQSDRAATVPPRAGSRRVPAQASAIPESRFRRKALTAFSGLSEPADPAGMGMSYRRWRRAPAQASLARRSHMSRLTTRYGQRRLLRPARQRSDGRPRGPHDRVPGIGSQLGRCRRPPHRRSGGVRADSTNHIVGDRHDRIACTCRGKQSTIRYIHGRQSPRALERSRPVQRAHPDSSASSATSRNPSPTSGRRAASASIEREPAHMLRPG
jgi:hypothetical protein